MSARRKGTLFFCQPERVPESKDLTVSLASYYEHLTPTVRSATRGLAQDDKKKGRVLAATANFLKLTVRICGQCFV